jgi:hypothetical protein
VVGGRYTWASWTLVRADDDIVYLYNGYTAIRVGGYVDFVMDGRGRRLVPKGSTETIPARVMAAIRATYRPDAAPTTPGQPILSRPGETILEVGRRLTFRSSKAGELTVGYHVSTCSVYNECACALQIICIRILCTR